MTKEKFQTFYKICDVAEALHDGVCSINSGRYSLKHKVADYFPQENRN